MFLEELVFRKMCKMLKVKVVEDGVLAFESISRIKKMFLSCVHPMLDFVEITSTVKKKGGEDLEQKPVVLVIDDDAVIRKMLSQILKAEGYMVETVETGKQAIAASKKRFFNVALVDMRLQDMRGTALIHELKEAEPRMIRIIVTGYASTENAIESVNRNADGYILKPIDVQELLAMIEKKTEETARR
jgi:ActR/RegA family two-component response regulator